MRTKIIFSCVSKLCWLLRSELQRRGKRKTGIFSVDETRDFCCFWKVGCSSFKRCLPPRPRRHPRLLGCRRSTGSDCLAGAAWSASSPCTSPRWGCRAQRSHRRKPEGKKRVWFGARTIKECVKKYFLHSRQSLKAWSTVLHEQNPTRQDMDGEENC